MVTGGRGMGAGDVLAADSQVQFPLTAVEHLLPFIWAENGARLHETSTKCLRCNEFELLSIRCAYQQRKQYICPIEV